ncbi:hypothetical protein PSN45_002085 [Yamadazyma tenuis]|uniref:uncharacterized protein n=1 Tax=Candida tenuis TaxID=2315449 RepID=UPI0027A770A6|nr:hypothetical protein PSN45_002085 [Yamadazyma tenuis]
MKKNACCSLTGFQSHLPTSVVRIPLRYNDHGADSHDVHEKFTKKLAVSSQLIEFEKHPSFVDVVSIDIPADLTAIRLCPVISSSQLKLDLQNVVIDLPNKMISNTCFSVTIEEQENDDLNLIVDFIDERFLFITVRVNLKDFVVGEGSGFELSNFKHWGNISVPYSFEMRSNPFFIKSIDHNNCIVSLTDGGLLHFSRTGTLEAFNIFNFREDSKLSLGFFNAFFKDNASGKNCAVDLIVVKEKLVIMTVDKHIKVFDINTHELVNVLQVSNDGNFLTLVPNKYLQSFIVDDKTFILSHAANSLDVQGKLQFQVWNVDDFQGKTFEVTLPDTTLDEHKIKPWYIQDYCIEVVTSNHIKIHILWKSNFSSLVATYSVDASTLTIIEVESSAVDDDEEFLQMFDQEYYKNQVMNSGAYDELVLDTAFETLRERLNLKSSKLVLEALNKETADDISEAHTEFFDKGWFVLYSLCEEYKKLCKESLSISVIKGKTIILQTNGVGIFRPLSLFEVFANNEGDPLNQLLRGITLKLSNKAIYKVYQYIASAKQLTEEDLDYISDNLIGGKFDDDQEAMSNVLDFYDGTTNDISSYSTADFDLKSEGNSTAIKTLYTLINGPHVEELGYENNLSIIDKIYTIVAFKDISKVQKELLVRLVILISNIDADNEVLVHLANSVLQKLKDFRLFDFLFSKNYEDSIIWKQKIAKGDVLNKYNYLNQNIHEQDYLIKIVIELVDSNSEQNILNEMLDKLDYESNQYLIGLIYLLNKDIKAVDLLSYDNYRSFGSKRYHFNNELNDFLSSNFTNEPEYYHNLSKLIASQKDEVFLHKSIELELKAIDLADDFVDNSSYYKNVFELSIKLFDIETILKSLVNLQEIPEFENSMKVFVQALFGRGSVNTIFNISSSKGEYSQFFIDNFKLIDIILNEIAEAQPILVSMKYYDIICAWRIHNSLRRNSIEALYKFITRFAKESPSLSLENLKIGYLKALEYYLIIINCLKTFKNDNDRWLIKNDSKNELISLAQLSQEYVHCLKMLNSL